MIFISLQKIFSFPKYSIFEILECLISWLHQMLNHETRSTFYWWYWELSGSWSWNLASLFTITKEKVLSKNSTKNVDGKPALGFFYVYVELSATYNGKFNVWNKLSFEAELSKYVKIGMKTSGVTLL